MGMRSPILSEAFSPSMTRISGRCSTLVLLSLASVTGTLPESPEKVIEPLEVGRTRLIWVVSSRLMAPTRAFPVAGSCRQADD